MAHILLPKTFGCLQKLIFQLVGDRRTLEDGASTIVRPFDMRGLANEHQNFVWNLVLSDEANRLAERPLEVRQALRDSD